MRNTPRSISLLALPGVQLLDVSGPLDVFAEANVQCGKAVYRLSVIGSEKGALPSSSGVRILPDRFIGDQGGVEKIDTLLIAGRPKAAELSVGREVIAWVKAMAPRTRRFGSVCSGAFVLAEAGLLKGRRVTTHWAVAEKLAERYPEVTIERDAIHVRHGKVRTAAGVTAGMDLALALVEEDLGPEIARQVARQLVMFFKRPGGQLQFSSHGEAKLSGRAALQEVQRWVSANPRLDHSVAALASRMDVSPRHFARLFRNEVGVTPRSWVEAARVAAARTLLEEGQRPPKEIAGLCGFADSGTLRRVFLRHMGVTPAEYRKRFPTIAGD